MPCPPKQAQHINLSYDLGLIPDIPLGYNRYAKEGPPWVPETQLTRDCGAIAPRYLWDYAHLARWPPCGVSCFHTTGTSLMLPGSSSGTISTYMPFPAQR